MEPANLPLLTLTPNNYRIWALRLRTYLISLDLWPLVISSDESSHYQELREMKTRSRPMEVEYQELRSKAARATHLLLAHLSDEVALMCADVFPSSTSTEPSDPTELWYTLESTFSWARSGLDPSTQFRLATLKTLLGLDGEAGTLTRGPEQSVLEFYALHRILFNEYVELMGGQVNEDERMAAQQDWTWATDQTASHSLSARKVDMWEAYWHLRNVSTVETDNKQSAETEALLAKSEVTVRPPPRKKAASQPKQPVETAQPATTPKGPKKTAPEPSVADTTEHGERLCTSCGKTGHTVEVCWDNPCTVCGKKGHPTKKCWNNVNCDKCGKPGHPSTSCWNMPCEVCQRRGHQSGECYFAPENKGKPRPKWEKDQDAGSAKNGVKREWKVKEGKKEWKDVREKAQGGQKQKWEKKETPAVDSEGGAPIGTPKAEDKASWETEEGPGVDDYGW